jgi:CBS domain-containing protein
MLERKIGCVPVVDARDRLLGLVTETDILRLAREVVFEQIPEPRKAG